MEGEEPSSTPAPLAQLQFQPGPSLMASAHHEYAAAQPSQPQLRNSNFLKGVRWSPDGACLLTSSDDSWLRVYDLPEEALDCDPLEPSTSSVDSLRSALRVQGGESVYDYAWYPGMHSASPASCLFASSSRASPLHLWDAVTGELRATYRAYDAADEVTAATSLAFSPDGARLYGGYQRMLRVFDTSRPGRTYKELPTFRQGQDGLPGLVSCMAFNPDHSGLFAAGSYSGTVGLYQEGTHELLFLLQGHKGGLTQVQFSSDGNFLYTGARRDPSIVCWDVRYSFGEVFRLTRATEGTNQRVAFDIEPYGQYLATGGEDGLARVFDLRTGEESASWHAAGDCVNGLHFHPTLPLVATASGQRRFYEAPSSDSDSTSEEEGRPPKGRRQRPKGILGVDENCLRLWRCEYIEDLLQEDVQDEAMQGGEGEREGEKVERGVEEGVMQEGGEEAKRTGNSDVAEVTGGNMEVETGLGVEESVMHGKGGEEAETARNEEVAEAAEGIPDSTAPSTAAAATVEKAVQEEGEEAETARKRKVAEVA